jgi:hypothetical protein
MSTIPSSGQFTQIILFGTQQAILFESAMHDFLGFFDVKEARMDARSMEGFATRLTASVADHVEKLSAALDPSEKRNILRIAEKNGIEPRAAKIEYLAKAFLFRAFRHYFDLPQTNIFPHLDKGGFLVFTSNGSMVASPPTPERERTLHYTRMPSRKIPFQTSSQDGHMHRDIVCGHRLATSAFTTSAVQMLLYVPKEQSHLFDTICENAITGSFTISTFVTLGH